MSAQIFLNYHSHGISNCLTKAKKFQKSCEKVSSLKVGPRFWCVETDTFKWHRNAGVFTETGL